MRDNTIVNEFGKSNQRLATLFVQFEWLEQRQQAYEQCIVNSTWKQRIKWLINPNLFLQFVDAVHLKINELEKAKLEKLMKQKPLVRSRIILP